MQASYDRLDYTCIGANWFIKGNTSCFITKRPVYSLVGDDLISASSRKAQYVVQYQFFF